MGIDGFFLGGAAQGLNESRKLNILQNKDELDAQKGLLDQVDTAVDGTMKVITSVIKASREAGKTPQQTQQAVAPLLSDITGLYARTGRDPSRITNQVNALISSPVAPEGPYTELGKLKQDAAAGYVPQDVYNASVAKASRPEKPPSTFESIYQKIAAGDELTPGEQQLYADRKKAANDFFSGLAALTGVGPSAAEDSSANAPSPFAPSSSAETPSSPKLAAATAGAKPVQAVSTPSFNSIEDARKALGEGKLKVGDVVMIKGKQMRVQ